MEQQVYQAPDAIISAPTPQGSQQRPAIVGNILFAQNRGKTKAGQDYKAHQLSLNVEQLQKGIADGSIKVSKSGVAYFNFTTLSDEAKAKMTENHKNKPAQAAKTGGAFGAKPGNKVF